MSYRSGAILLSAVLVLSAGCIDTPSSAHEAGSADVNPAKEVRVLVLEGTPYERGLAHGRSLKKEIHEIVALWKAQLGSPGGIHADAFIQKFLQETDFEPAIEKWTPGLLEEVRGIADGAEIDFDTIYAFQLMDEIWLYQSGLEGEACSAIAFERQGDRPTLVAQNMDLEPFREGYQVLMHVKHPDSDLESLFLTCAGLIVATGMNNTPLGIAVNAMGQMDYGPEGLPVAFVVRGLLEQKSLEAAVGFLKTVQHASGQNYILGDSENVVDLEVSTNQLARFTPENHPGVILHTNHPRVLTDYHSQYEDSLAGGATPMGLGENTHVRLSALEARLGSRQGSLSIDDIKSTLSSQDDSANPVCRPHDTGKSSFTFGTVIQVLSDSPELHLAPGPPNVTPFQVFPFQKGS